MSHPPSLTPEEESALLKSLQEGGARGWQDFLGACSGIIFQVAALFTSSYDDRMDLFLFVCERLHEDEMRRLRTFRRKPGAPCRFTTWLRVVVRNLAVDFLRANEGRFREFRTVREMDEIDSMVFRYHLRDGLALDEVRERLRDLHSIEIGPDEVAARAARVRETLSASQRWRLLSRLMARQSPAAIDPTAERMIAGGRSLPLPSFPGGPEEPLIRGETGRILERAIGELTPRQRLVLALRFDDGLATTEIARTLSASGAEVERIGREALERLRSGLAGSGMVRADLESALRGRSLRERRAGWSP